MAQGTGRAQASPSTSRVSASQQGVSGKEGHGGAEGPERVLTEQPPPQHKGRTRWGSGGPGRLEGSQWGATSGCGSRLCLRHFCHLHGGIT